MDPAVFGYIRVSQAEGASGLATQSRILTDHGLRDDRIFTDVASGRNMRRPAWTTLRETLRPGDVVVVPRIDRLARNLTEGLRAIEELHVQGIHIRSLVEGLDTGDGSPNARLMLHMLLSLAEWERETIRAGSGPAWTAPRPRAGLGAGPGAGLREAAGRPGTAGQRAVHQRDRQDRQGGPGNRAGRQGRGVPGSQR